MAELVVYDTVVACLPKSDEERNPLCTICHEKWIPTSKPWRHLACGEAWHPTCILPWLTQEGPVSCPNCRRRILFDGEENIYLYDSPLYTWCDYWHRWNFAKLPKESDEDFLARPGHQAQQTFHVAVEAAYAKVQRDIAQYRRMFDENRKYWEKTRSMLSSEYRQRLRSASPEAHAAAKQEYAAAKQEYAVALEEALKEAVDTDMEEVKAADLYKRIDRVETTYEQEVKQLYADFEESVPVDLLSQEWFKKMPKALPLDNLRRPGVDDSTEEVICNDEVV